MSENDAARQETATTHPRSKNGRVLSGECSDCGQPIYGWEDHAEDCPTRVMVEGGQ